VSILGAGGGHLDRTPRRAEANVAATRFRALFSTLAKK
jgi:hypothetical protein